MLNLKTKKRRSFFSLIELLIVIGIMGALAALILPHFSDSETSAKDTACDYNNAGILRYVTMFKATNGVYPSGFHTGTSDAAGATTDDPVKSMAVVTRGNITTATEVIDITDKEDDEGNSTGYGGSLKEAGIATLAYEKKAAEETGEKVTAVLAISGDWSETMNADGSYKSVENGADPITIRGIALSDWIEAGNASEGNYNDLTDDQKRCRKSTEGKFKLVPLFASSTIDWDTAYPNGGLATPSKVGIAMEGKCPWLDAGSFRYYICIFKVYEDGEAAKLIATACPECGILDADSY